MSEPLIDQLARDRFRDEWDRNFAVSANAGSGKTTAISERLAALALSAQGPELLRRTAVVTFTRKAAAQIGQRARAVLLRRLQAEGATDLAPLDHLERAFFGTIHSFCLLLAQRHGQWLGLDLQPTVIEGEEMEDALWEEFLEQDEMQFTALVPAQVEAFLRHTPLDAIFGLARRLGHGEAERLRAHPPALLPTGPSAAVLAELLAASGRGRSAETLKANQAAAVEWRRRFQAEQGYLPLPVPQGTAAGVVGLYARWLAPLKEWLAAAGAVLAAELAQRYRKWRQERGVQTYADQVEAALALLRHREVLEALRCEGWRIILDEAQDTDPHQFAVLAEITRPPGAEPGTWPAGGGDGPRAGHFCLVGDPQQSIYGSRADIRNFQSHLAAFARGDGGERLTFQVTFRAPEQAIAVLNDTLPGAFGPGRAHNLGLPPDEAAAPLLQVPYEPLVAGPGNERGTVAVLTVPPAAGGASVDARLAAEARAVAAWLAARGPAGVGARRWGDICVLAPRNDWLVTVRREFEKARLKTSLQIRKHRNADNPAYAWVSGLLAAVCDPANTFEWIGVLRELFPVTDSRIAAELGGGRTLRWDEPETHAAPVAAALRTLRPLVDQVDAEGQPLESFARQLLTTGGLVAKARAVDPSGALEEELQRLLTQAAELGLEGAGPRDWLRELLARREMGRPAGRSGEDAITLLTTHSAKGLEWPVVIPVGLWRPIGKYDEPGLRLVADEAAGARVYFDQSSLPEAVREARERERQRELVRLLYVTLTRARSSLVLPVGMTARGQATGSFLDLWGAQLDHLPRVADAEWPAWPEAAVPEGADLPASVPGSGRIQTIEFPRRILPHQLAQHVDAVRTYRTEGGADEPSAPSRIDPLDYGTWWHETLEFVPWLASDADLAPYWSHRITVAEAKGMAGRATRELAALQLSPAWRTLRERRWRVLTEVSVVAPWADQAWVDGVIDLVAHDPASREILIVDWKTNQLQAGEPPADLLRRLQEEYQAQLDAYHTCLARFFPEVRFRMALYATATGDWVIW